MGWSTTYTTFLVILSIIPQSGGSLEGEIWAHAFIGMSALIH